MIKLFDTSVSAEEQEIVCCVLASGKTAVGPHVPALEEELAEFLGGGHVVTCNSGTDALTLCYETLALDTFGDCIVPAMTFSATAESVINSGHDVAFIDIIETLASPCTPELNHLISERIDSRLGTAAVILPHLYGHPAYYLREIKAVCEFYKVPLIEDCAQCFGADLDGVMLGSWGDAAAFSFYPTKPLGGIGHGGAAWFKEKEQADWARSRRNHGRTPEGSQVRVGYNSRMDEANAAVLRDRLSRYRGSIDSRRELSDRYSQRGLLPLSLRTRGSGVPACYPILVDQREALRFRLADLGVETGVHYDTALSDMGHLGGLRNCPNATRFAQRIVTLPCHPKMSYHDVDRIADVVLTESARGETENAGA